MNREIKFRAWDKETKEMLDWDILGKPNGCTGSWCYTSNSNWILMQFTGLHDKNGKEIYEGDLVKGHRPACRLLREKDWLGIIEYAKVRCSFVVRVKHLDGIDTFDNLISCDTNNQVDAETLTDYQYEVIGNIYQTPELLNK